MNPREADSVRERVHLTDHHPQFGDDRKQILEGLGSEPKTISPKYFYDRRGSELFDRITDLPEYYVGRCEIEIFESHGSEIAESIGPDSFLIEYGSGSSQKIELLLEQLRPRGYMPVDISREHLLASARRIASRFPWLEVYPTCADYGRVFELPRESKGLRTVAFFPGSTVGNFEPEAAADFLRNIARVVGTDGQLLIGVDLVKDTEKLNRAYNDSAGVTADFNLNVLAHLNREFDADFDIEQFEHVAFYDEPHHRIEMHLESRRDQVVNVAGRAFRFEIGERMRTERSHKYTVERFLELAAAGGFRGERHWTDARGYFAEFLLRADAIE